MKLPVHVLLTLLMLDRCWHLATFLNVMYAFINQESEGIDVGGQRLKPYLIAQPWALFGFPT